MTVTLFGTTQAGEDVHKITLHSDTLTVSILTLGAILQDVRLAGVGHSLTLGSYDLAAYDQGPLAHFGAIMGPVANRIKEATAVLNGTALQFDKNVLGQHTLHGGSAAFHHKVWAIDEASDTSVSLSLVAPHGDGGFPGLRPVTARLDVTGSALTLSLSATTDRPTFLNLANHSYWNLDATPTFKGHKLQVMANTYLPTTDAFIPTGAIAPVEGTPFDLRNARDVVPAHADGFDNNFCVSSERRDLTHVATLTGQTGIGLEMWTTEPGLQVYDARAQGSGAFAGLNGAPYQNYCGLALEAQMWPNAPNEPAFPSIEITPDAAYRQITQWRFTQ